MTSQDPYVYPDNLRKEYIPPEVFAFFDRMYDLSISDSELFKGKFNLNIGECPVTLGYGGMNRMSCRPVGLQKVPGNHIFDEDQSVKWNREQVELNNKKYQSEVARLNTEKNKARDSVYNLIIEKIQYEVGHRLSRKKAEAIWNRAYEDGHSFGFYEIRCRLSDLIDLAITLLGGDK